MDRERPSHTVEDYLQLIYSMQRSGEAVISARIKERKGVSAPTAWATLKRMERDGLISLEADHSVELTEAGLELAESIVRRHMLAERLLTDILHLDWAEVHSEAHRLEHAISPVIEQQILSLLDNPTTCPHGNPIPGAAVLSRPALRPLRAVQSGETVTINNISEHAEEDSALMQYLERSGLLPGARLQVEEVEPSNATITLSLLPEGGKRVTVGLPTSDLVQVSTEERAL